MSKNKSMNLAERGGVYEFLEKDGMSKNLCIVISNNSRAADKIISILMIKDDLPGNDTVDVLKEDGNYIGVVHCGCTTYTYRNRLGQKLFKLPDSVMKEISDMINKQLGTDGCDPDYKKLYETLLDKVISKTN